MKKAILLTSIIALLLATPSPATPDNLSGVRKLMEVSRNGAALRDLEGIVAKDRENHEAWSLLAEVRLVFGDLDGAENAITNALEIVKDKNAAYWEILGRVSFERGIAAFAERRSSNEIKSWFADAEMKFSRVLKMEPKDQDIRCYLGWAKEWQEYPKEARAFYDEQIEMFPEVSDGYIRLGNMLSQEANGTENGLTEAAMEIRGKAMEVFDLGLEKAGPNAEIFYYRGLALEWMRQKDKAIASYESAVRADPEFDKAWRRMYDLKVGEGKIVPLAKELKKSATAAMWGAFFLLGADKDEEALNLVMPALEVYRENSGAYDQAFRASMNLLGTNPELALATMARLHEIYEFAGSAANNLGLYYRDKGRYKESLAWYLKSIEREPENQDLLNDTALIYLFHYTGAEQKKCLPILLKVVSLVQEYGQLPSTGYWDALENLCKYYWEVERNPALVVKYATMRYETTLGVEPYSRSPRALHYKKLAEGG